MSCTFKNTISFEYSITCYRFSISRTNRLIFITLADNILVGNLHIQSKTCVFVCVRRVEGQSRRAKTVRSHCTDAYETIGHIDDETERNVISPRIQARQHIKVHYTT